MKTWILAMVLMLSGCKPAPVSLLSFSDRTHATLLDPAQAFRRGLTPVVILGSADHLALSSPATINGMRVLVVRRGERIRLETDGVRYFATESGE